MKTIITAIDFSAASLNAANYAADLASAVGAKLLLLHIFQVPVSVAEIPMPEAVFEEMVDDSKQSLDDLGTNLTLRTKGKIPIATEVTVGTIEHQLEEFSRREKPFVVVMGLQAGSSLDRFVFGSSTLYALRRMPCPVLVVPAEASFSAISRTGLACDLEKVEALPYEKLIEWLSALHTGLDIIHVGKPDHTKPGELSESVALQKRLGAFHPEFHFISGKNLSEQLHEFAREQRLDMLVVVPKQHGLLDLFVEKHARKIVLQQRIPVLAIHGY